MESHCGQIEYVPAGWVQIVTKGPGAKTSIQCMRVKDRYIYAAQFHIELATSVAMGNKAVCAITLRCPEASSRQSQ